MSDSRLVDPFGRRITYLRLSVTDRCDFRCTYCMSEDMQFLPRDQVLSLEELYAVADAFIGLGVRRIRITGGEPLVRKGITGLLARLGQRAELEDLAITTNGSQLRERAAELKAAGVRRLNVSLDSLQRERFAAFTRSDRLEQVLDGIQAAREAGFERIKLNCVVQKGRNDDEILDLVEYALANQLDPPLPPPCLPGDRVSARTARCPVPGKATRRNAETRPRSHAACRASKGKPPMHRVLFICSRNRLRSPSAERLFADWPGVETDSAGLAADAETPLEREQLEWATLVVVMERRHRQALLPREVSPVRQGVRSAWAPARGCRTSGCGRCG